MTPHEIAPTSATAVQMAIERVLVLTAVPPLTTAAFLPGVSVS
jgi:hypothetical protein